MRHRKVKVCSRCRQPAELVAQRTICVSCNLIRKREVAARARSTEPGAVYNRTKTALYRQTPQGRARLMVFFAAKRAKTYNFECTITWHSVAEIIGRGRCEITGLPFDLKPRLDSHHANPWAPSLDRRDSSKGYTPDNVQVVVAAYNYAKSEWSADVLLKLARAIVDTAPSKDV